MYSVRFTPPSLFTFKSSCGYKIEGTPPVDLNSHEPHAVYKESARLFAAARCAITGAKTSNQK
jgi:hypothetical protein